MHFRPLTALIAVVLLATAGCQKHNSDKAVAAAAKTTTSARPAASHAAPSPAKSAATPPASSASGQKSAAVKAAASPGSEVKLLSAGTAPRRVLRYHFKAGQIEKFKLTSTTAMSIKLGDKPMPAPAIPTLDMIASVKIVSVSPDGTAKRDLTIDKVELANRDKLPAAVQNSVQDSLSELAKLKGHDELDSRGRLRSSTLDTSALDNGQVKQMMQAMASAFGEVSAPFPEQAVGKGARWQVSTLVEQMGMKMRQQATYTLAKLDGDNGTTKIELKQSAPGSRIQIPGVPLGVHSDLLGMTGSGQGQMAFNLGRSLPEGNITTESNVKVRTEMAGRSQDTQMDMTLTEQFTRM